MKDCNFSIRTDLAAESAEAVFSGGEPDVDGIFVETVTLSGLRCDRMTVSTDEGSLKLGKPCGRYVTVTVPRLSSISQEERDSAARVISAELSSLLPGGKRCLIAALGNRSISADSQGPLCADGLIVTRHIKDSDPDIFHGLGMLETSCIVPGVLGMTGIEAAEVVRGIAQRVEPDFIIAVDSLAARRTSRVGCTVQITDTGISPGSGIGNRRAALSKRTLGVPVIAIGIPTVVDAATVGYDLLEERFASSDAAALDEKTRSEILSSVLSSESASFFLTPKDCDSLSSSAAELLALSINLTLNPSVVL